jgi:hypothetical protein
MPTRGRAHPKTPARRGASLFPFYGHGRRPACEWRAIYLDGKETNRREGDASQRRLRYRPVKPDIGVALPAVCHPSG